MRLLPKDFRPRNFSGAVFAVARTDEVSRAFDRR
jgi:hypothetical protein